MDTVGVGLVVDEAAWVVDAGIDVVVADTIEDPIELPVEVTIELPPEVVAFATPVDDVAGVPREDDEFEA